MNQTLLKDSSPPPKFGEIDGNYGGKPPTAKFLIRAFLDEAITSRPRIERDINSRCPHGIVSIDHAFKITKYIQQYGSRRFYSHFCIYNRLGNVIGWRFCETAGLTEIKDWLAISFNLASYIYVTLLPLHIHAKKYYSFLT